MSVVDGHDSFDGEGSTPKLDDFPNVFPRHGGVQLFADILRLRDEAWAFAQGRHRGHGNPSLLCLCREPERMSCETCHAAHGKLDRNAPAGAQVAFALSDDRRIHRETERRIPRAPAALDQIARCAAILE